MKVNIDGDELIYRAAFACQQKRYKYRSVEAPEGGTAHVAEFRYKRDASAWLAEQSEEFIETVEEVVEPVQNALYSIKNTVRTILKETGADDYCIYLGGKGNFRLRVFPEYKAGRPPKPVHYQACRDYLSYEFNTVVVDGIEADDALGIAQGKDTIICSQDKDLDTVPGWHYNHVKNEFYFVEPNDAEHWFWVQMLVGDRVDNIQGLSGVGEATALKLLEPFGRDFIKIEGFVKSCYVVDLGDEDLSLFNMNLKLIRILQEEVDE